MHLARAASEGDGDGGDGGSASASAPIHVIRRAVAAGGDGCERMAICWGRSEQLVCEQLPMPYAHERAAAALREPERLRGRGKRTHTGHGRVCSRGKYAAVSSELS